MFKNTFQSGFLSILYSIGSKPLQIWDKKVSTNNVHSLSICICGSIAGAAGAQIPGYLRISRCVHLWTLNDNYGLTLILYLCTESSGRHVSLPMISLANVFANPKF